MTDRPQATHSSVLRPPSDDICFCCTCPTCCSRAELSYAPRGNSHTSDAASIHSGPSERSLSYSALVSTATAAPHAGNAPLNPPVGMPGGLRHDVGPFSPMVSVNGSSATSNRFQVCVVRLLRLWTVWEVCWPCEVQMVPVASSDGSG